MPWNKPGRSNPDDHDHPTPWEKKKQAPLPHSPPDLETLLRQGGKWLRTQLRLNPSVSSKLGICGTFTQRYRFIFMLGLLLLIELAWGILVVHADEQVLVTRFGQYQRTLPPGYHWVFRPIEQALRVPQNSQSLIEQSHFILADQNPASLSIKVTYSIIHPIDYVFNFSRPLENLKQTVQAVLYQHISPLSFESLLALDRTQYAETLKTAINSRLHAMKAGLVITQIVLNPLDLPPELKTAFDEVNSARDHQLNIENEAKTNALQLKLQTQGEAEHLLEEAKNYQHAVVLKAKKEVALFLEQLPSYKLLPKLTEQRLYFEALQAMMPYSHTILMTGSSTLPPLPWILASQDALTKQLNATNRASTENTAVPSQSKITPGNKTMELPSSYETAGDYSTGGYDDNAL
jgi:modulator of FtsH protease HflK